MKFKRFAIACAALALFSGSAYAQNCDQLCLPNGTPVTCNVDPNGTKVWVDLSGNVIPGQTQGQGDFEVVQCDCATATLYLAPTNLDIVSHNPVFGTIRTYIDPTRTPNLATLTLNSDNAYTENFYFYVKADVPGFPPLTGIQELHFRSHQVRSFNPHINERFQQVAPVDFVDDAGNIVLTLKATQITLTP